MLFSGLSGGGVPGSAMLIAAAVCICTVLCIIVYKARSGNRDGRGPYRKRRGLSEQVQMDTLAYGSRMVGWSPLGKLLFILCIIITGLLTDSILVPICTFAIGLTMMIYSTNLKIPSILALAIGESMLIMIIGCGMISIMGSASEPAIWDTDILLFHVYITDASFNLAWLVFMRSAAGVTLMLAFASSTPIPHLSQALGQIKVPKEITEIIVLVYRYSFLLLEEMQIMYRAADCRMGFSGFTKSFRTVAGIAAGVFSSSIDISDRAQNALMCRNYSGTFPVFRSPKKISVGWIAAVIVSAAILFAFGQYSSGWINISEVFFGGIR
ncbi:MAG: cobalt ECF transporter T component CbiQ [Candidatus Methanoplasma sp.]|jgi:cobalt ECF transporter T component CbiQ|nr:cobalt ECF transporter T component CbiQ [Candidatus Methanoplasma sp.]